jgi:sec-independent protein translocase protein TatA
MAKRNKRFLLPTERFPFLIRTIHGGGIKENVMFGIGMPEMVIILVIALIVIGPHKLPELAKSLVMGLAEFKKATDDFQKNVQEESRKSDEKEKETTPSQVAVAEPAHVHTTPPAPHAVPVEKQEHPKS